MDKQKANNQYAAALVGKYLHMWNAIDKNKHVAIFAKPNIFIHSVTLLTFGYGMSTGWSSPSIHLLTSIESPLPTGPISIEEASWIASVNSIGGLIGNFFFGFITCQFGRKIPLILMAVPTIVNISFLPFFLKTFFIQFVFIFQISWILVLYAKNVFYLYASKVITGLVGGACSVGIPLYLQEIANNR